MVMLILDLHNLVNCLLKLQVVDYSRVMDQFCLFSIKIIFICVRRVGFMILPAPPLETNKLPNLGLFHWVYYYGQSFSSIFLKIAFNHSANLKNSGC